jgi:hypothetical protein
MLEPIAWRACCRCTTEPIAADQPIERAEAESVAGVLLLRLTLAGRSESLISIDRSEPEVPVDLPHARATARTADIGCPLHVQILIRVPVA